MKNIIIQGDTITIKEEKKGFFSTKEITTKILVDEISEFSIEELQGEIKFVTIFYEKNKEESFTYDKSGNIDKLLKYIVDKRDNGKNIKIIKIDIDTLEEKEI